MVINFSLSLALHYRNPYPRPVSVLLVLWCCVIIIYRYMLLQHLCLQARGRRHSLAEVNSPNQCTYTHKINSATMSCKYLFHTSLESYELLLPDQPMATWLLYLHPLYYYAFYEFKFVYII